MNEQRWTKASPLLVVLMVVACQTEPGSEQLGSPDGPTSEAKAFMEGYARDLKAGDVDALAARYDTIGAYLVGNGTKEFLAHDSIAGLYRAAAATTRPESFVWENLSYEPLGPDVVLVVGRFTATYRGSSRTLSYSSVLRRQAGSLRILMEDESYDPSKVERFPRVDSTNADKVP